MTFDIYLIEQINPAYMSRSILLECLKLVQNHKEFEQHEEFNKKEFEKKLHKDDEYFAEVLAAEIEKIQGELAFQEQEKERLEREWIHDQGEQQECSDDQDHVNQSQEQDLQKSIADKTHRLNELENQYSHLLIEIMQWEEDNCRKPLQIKAIEVIQAALKPSDVFSLECLKFIIQFILGKQASNAEIEQIKQDLLNHPDFKKGNGFNEDRLRFIAKFILGDHLSSDEIDNQVNLIQANLKFKTLSTISYHPKVVEFITHNLHKTEENIEKGLAARAMPHQLARMVPKLKMAFKRVYDEELEKEMASEAHAEKAHAKDALAKALTLVNEIHAPVSRLNTEAIPVANYAQFFRDLYTHCRESLELDLKMLFNKTALQMALVCVKDPEYRTKLELYQSELSNCSNLIAPQTELLFKIFFEKDQLHSDVQRMTNTLKSFTAKPADLDEAGVSLRHGN